MKIEYKKNAVDLTDLAIGIVILGIVISVGATVLHTMRDSQVTNLGTYSVNLESQNLTAKSGSANLNSIWVKSVDSIQVGTQVLTPTLNYTSSINPNTGVATITNLTSDYNGLLYRVNYTVYNVSDPRFAVPNSGEIGLLEYGNWFKIIVIVGVAAVILGLIFMAFGKNSSSAGIGGTY